MVFLHDQKRVVRRSAALDPAEAAYSVPQTSWLDLGSRCSFQDPHPRSPPSVSIFGLTGLKVPFHTSISGYIPCLKKNSQNCFSHSFVECLLNLIIFGTKMAKTMKSCNVHSFSTSTNLCKRTTVWNIINQSINQSIKFISDRNVHRTQVK